MNIKGSKMTLQERDRSQQRDERLASSEKSEYEPRKAHGEPLERAKTKPNTATHGSLVKKITKTKGTSAFWMWSMDRMVYY